MFPYDFVEDLDKKMKYTEVLADEIAHEHPYWFVVIAQVAAEFIQIADYFGKGEAPVDEFPYKLAALADSSTFQDAAVCICLVQYFQQVGAVRLEDPWRKVLNCWFLAGVLYFHFAWWLFI